MWNLTKIHDLEASTQGWIHPKPSAPSSLRSQNQSIQKSNSSPHLSGYTPKPIRINKSSQFRINKIQIINSHRVKRQHRSIVNGYCSREEDRKREPEKNSSSSSAARQSHGEAKSRTSSSRREPSRDRHSRGRPGERGSRDDSRLDSRRNHDRRDRSRSLMGRGRFVCPSFFFFFLIHSFSWFGLVR